MEIDISRINRGEPVTIIFEDGSSRTLGGACVSFTETANYSEYMPTTAITMEFRGIVHDCMPPRRERRMYEQELYEIEKEIPEEETPQSMESPSGMTEITW